MYCGFSVRLDYQIEHVQASLDPALYGNARDIIHLVAGGYHVVSVYIASGTDLVLEWQAAHAQETNQGPRRNEGCLTVVKLQLILLVTHLLYAFPSESTSQVSLPLPQTSLPPPTRSTTSQTLQNLPGPSLHYHHHCRRQDPREQL